MKFNSLKKIGRGITLLVAAAAVLARTQLPAMADPTPLTYPTGSPNFHVSDMNAFPLTLAASAGTNYTAGSTNSYMRTIRQDHGLSLVASVTVKNATTNALTGNHTFGFDLADDASLFTTGQPVTWTFPLTTPASSTNTYVVWTNLPASMLNNMRTIQCTLVTNTLSGGTEKVNRLDYSQSGNNP